MSFGLGYSGLSSAAIANYVGLEQRLGGIALDVRGLVQTHWLGSRLQLGGEYGATQIATGGGEKHVYTGGSSGTVLDVPTYAYFAHRLTMLAGLNLLATPTTALRMDLGAGLVFWDLPEYSAEEGYARPGTEPIGTVRLLLSIRASRSLTIDPYATMLKSAGDASAGSPGAGIAVSYLFGRR